MTIYSAQNCYCRHLVWFKMINDDIGDYSCMMGKKTSSDKCAGDLSLPCEYRELKQITQNEPPQKEEE